jgi:hypothetical protein
MDAMDHFGTLRGEYLGRSSSQNEPLANTDPRQISGQIQLEDGLSSKINIRSTRTLKEQIREHEIAVVELKPGTG